MIEKKIFVYDGKSGEIREIIDKQNGHKGSIYSLSFNNDGSQFITCSADKTTKLWDFEKGASFTVCQKRNFQIFDFWKFLKKFFSKNIPKT